MSALMTRLKKLEKATKQNEPLMVQLTYKGGKTEIIIDNYPHIIELIMRGTEETGLIDVSIINGEIEDNFYNAFKNENGEYPKIEMFFDTPPGEDKE